MIPYEKVRSAVGVLRFLRLGVSDPLSTYGGRRRRDEEITDIMVRVLNERGIQVAPKQEEKKHG